MHTAAMNLSAWSLARIARPSIMSLVVAVATIGGVTQPYARAEDASPVPVASASSVASEAPKTMCQSVSDLRLYIGFLRDQSIKEDGLLPVLVGAVASLSEARTLAGLVDEQYRPLADELVASLQDLGTAVRGFRGQGTVGAGLVQLGEAIAGVGAKMDTLSTALRAPCPVEEPGASGLPAASASPGA